MHIVILGDSIAQGLGVAGRSYGDILAVELGGARERSQVTNLATSAAMISYSMTLLPDVIALRPEVVIIAHGITEAIVRPTPAALRFVPRRWRQPGWLDPRPYFSRRFWKGLYHRTESAVRWRIKVQLIKRCGAYTSMSTEEFERMLTETVETLLHRTMAHIILLTHNGVDERFYPGSLSSLNQYQHITEQVAADSQAERVQICDVSHSLDEWSDFFADHFHPNSTGHTKIAQAICEILQTHATKPYFSKNA